MNEIRQATVYGIRPTRTFKQAATKYLNDYQHKKSLERDVYAFKCIVPHIGRPVARTGSRPEPLTKSWQEQDRLFKELPGHLRSMAEDEGPG